MIKYSRNNRPDRFFANIFPCMAFLFHLIGKNLTEKKLGCMIKGKRERIFRKIYTQCQIRQRSVDGQYKTG